MTNSRNKSLKTVLKIQNYHNKRGSLKYSKSLPTYWKMVDDFNISDIIFLNLGRNKVRRKVGRNFHALMDVYKFPIVTSLQQLFCIHLPYSQELIPK